MPPRPSEPGKVSAKEIVGAAQRADLDAVRSLLDRGADPNASYRNYRPLHALIQEEPHAGAPFASKARLASLDLLLERGADPERFGAWPPARATIIAAFVGSREILDRLLDAGGEANIFVAAALGDSAGVARWFKRQPGLATARDGEGLTALQCCAGSRLGRDDPKTASGLLAVAARFLDAGADPNAITRSWGHDVDVAYFAANAKNATILELLLDRGADATRALPSAVWNGDFALAEIVLSRGASIDRAIDGDRPLLNNLIRWGQFRQALWLLERGADPNVVGAEGWTPLHQAVSRGNVRMVEALLHAGASAAREAEDGRTPPMLARELGRAKVVAALASY